MTYKEVLPIWWSMTWRGIVVGLIVFTIVGMFLAFVAAWAGYPDLFGLWSEIVGLIANILLNIWALRAAINTHMLRPASPDQ